MTHNLRWTIGNEKLNKPNGGTYRILGYGIPADFSFTVDGIEHNTCPSALACRAVCYAKQGRYRMASVANARLHNLNAFLSSREGFIASALADLQRLSKRFNVVRIHDSGDFFSQEYLNAWKVIAAAFPAVIFYAYTKTLHLDFSEMPSNFRITQSLGGKNDAALDVNRSHSRIFADDAARIAAGYVDGNANDVPAIEGVGRIGLVFHGQKKLTPAQIAYFR